jgi:hypothetical protein
MKKATAAVAMVFAALLSTACNGSSPVAPSVRESADNHVEPPGVLSTPNGGARATTRDNHVEPPGVLLRDGGTGRQDIETSGDVEAR